MSGANTTIDARAAVRLAIKRRYGREITGDLWSTVIPSDDPPAGLGSQDGDDWQITLDRASAGMSNQGYTMSPISLAEADSERAAVLDGSVALLVSKVSETTAIDTQQWRLSSLHLLLGAGALTAAFAALGTARRGSRRRRR